MAKVFGTLRYLNNCAGYFWTHVTASAFINTVSGSQWISASIACQPESPSKRALGWALPRGLLSSSGFPFWLKMAFLEEVTVKARWGSGFGLRWKGRDSFPSPLFALGALWKVMVLGILHYRSEWQGHLHRDDPVKRRPRALLSFS